MSVLSTRSNRAWTVMAHALAPALIGGLEAVRLGSASVALVLVPLFAATGLVAGAVIALAERLVVGRPRYLAALGIAAPSLLVTIPVAMTLFRGSYAQTLPAASVLPVVLPLVAWLLIALAVGIGQRLVAGDLTARAIAILAVAGLLGAIVWAERRFLGTGYLDAQIGATLAIIVLAGVAVRIMRRVRAPAYLAAALAAIVVGGAIVATRWGLSDPRDRSVLANHGDHGRDLVRLWRDLLDRDGDGNAPLLGGGDCDDGDPARHPGAVDMPGDGIDQDCTGGDASATAAPDPTPQLDLAAWRTRPEVRTVLDRTKAMNILVIAVDALRYDLLAPGAPHREDFPRLARLLDESVLFTRAIAPAAGTDISLSTLLTGRTNPFQTVEWTLPEAMRTLGRRTVGAMPAEVTRHVGEVLLRRGFDLYRSVYTDWGKNDVGDHLSAGTTTAEGLRAIDKAGETPWFLWLHYFDVHEHHQLDISDELLARVWDGGSEKAHRYRALLGNIDRSIGRLLDGMAERGRLERTIILFVSDHGESIDGDPRMPATHGLVAYAPLVRIPIAFRIPGVTPGVRTDPVSLVDVAPTLLELLGAPAAMAPLDGFDLVPAILDAPAPLRPPVTRPLVVHEEHQWSVVEWPYQLIVRPADDLVELYEIERDPLARVDLAPGKPELTARLRARYAEVPQVRVDRTAAGRSWRERLAQPPPRRAPP